MCFAQWYHKVKVWWNSEYFTGHLNPNMSFCPETWIMKISTDAYQTFVFDVNQNSSLTKYFLMLKAKYPLGLAIDFYFEKFLLNIIISMQILQNASS